MVSLRRVGDRAMETVIGITGLVVAYGVATTVLIPLSDWVIALL